MQHWVNIASVDTQLICRLTARHLVTDLFESKACGIKKFFFCRKVMEIREEIEKDFADVYEIVSAAFGNEAEARLVEKLRKIAHISLVATVDDKVVGHICFSPVTVEGISQETNFWGLAPMAVSPRYQKQGIGSKLINEGLTVCAKRGIEAIFVLGNKDYYRRFGFQTAASRRFTCEYLDPGEHFMVFEVVKGALEDKQGLVKYAPEFAQCQV